MGNQHHYVQLTLDNQILPKERLIDTPSMQDGIDPETEMDLRIYGCELIQLAGVHGVLSKRSKVCTPFSYLHLCVFCVLMCAVSILCVYVLNVLTFESRVYTLLCR